MTTEQLAAIRQNNERKFEPQRGRRAQHCWIAGPPQEDGMHTTCIRHAYHTGPHVWTRHDQITIALQPPTQTNAESKPA